MVCFVFDYFKRIFENKLRDKTFWSFLIIKVC